MMSKDSRKIEDMKRDLPYGIWVCEDGREILFNRRYKPIWQRSPEGKVSPANSEEWVERIKTTTHFYKDENSPWRDKRSLDKCKVVLLEWNV